MTETMAEKDSEVVNQEIVQEFQILDFAEEILINIFNSFDNFTLIQSTKVCRRFKRIAELTVRDKYKGIGNWECNFYELKEYPDDADDQRIQHEPFFSTFGTQITAIKIGFYHRNVETDNWMIEFIHEHCPFVSKIVLGQYAQPSYRWTITELEEIMFRFPQLQFLKLNNINFDSSEWSCFTYSSLTEVVFNYVDIPDLKTLQDFLIHNDQLESFKFSELNHVTFAVFDGSNLRELIHEETLYRTLSSSEANSKFFEDSFDVRMEMLKKISVENSSIDLFEMLATGCKNIETLKIFAQKDLIEIAENQINAIRSLTRISSLNLKGVRLSVDQVKELIAHSSNLTEFECTCGNNIFIDDVKDVVSFAKQHNNLVKIRLISTFDNMNPSKNLGMEFHKWFKRNAKNDLQLDLLMKIGVSLSKEFTVTKNKITQNGVVVLWNDYEQRFNYPGQSETHFLQLEEKCFKKIIDYLNQFEKLSLYQTCNRMKELIEPMFQQEYAENSFSLNCDSPMMEYFIRYFGKYMKNISFGSNRQCKNINNRCTFHWELIHKYCKFSLANLTVQHSSFSEHILFMSENQTLLPNLKQLKFDVPITHLTNESNFDRVVLKYSFCPNLKHLEIGSGIALFNLANVNFDLSNLTTLRIKRYTPGWTNFLRALNDTTHHNLSDLTLQNFHDVGSGRHRYHLNNKIVNEIARFPNLESLDLLLVGYEIANTKFLFELCSKLKILSIAIGSSIPYPFFENIKNICSKLETLNIVVKRNQKITGLLYLNAVRKYFPSRLIIKVFEFDSYGHFTDGFILDDKWLTDCIKIRSSIHQ